jgi:hypothetical protein
MWLGHLCGDEEFEICVVHHRLLVEGDKVVSTSLLDLS